MEIKSTQYRDSKEHFDLIDEHVKKYDDIENRNHLVKLATRLFLESRRNKGNFTRIK
tara:strand:+ start:472 stop:642 length:171 start_codon:yes stop_codon:yes gene_type:complete